LGRVEKSIEIRAPHEKVWEMLAVDRFPEWDEGTQKMRRAWNTPQRCTLPKTSIGWVQLLTLLTNMAN